MRMSRALIGLLAAALLGLVPIALTGSSAHAATYATQVAASSADKAYLYGATIRIDARILRSDGVGVPDTAGGQVLLQRLVEPVANNSWKTVGSRADESIDLVFRTQAVRNAYYRVVYTGGTDSAGHVYQASQLQSGMMRVGRNPGASAYKSGGKVYIKGDVNPGWGGRNVEILKKNCQTCKWFVWKRVRTGTGGRYNVQVSYPSKVGVNWFWRVRVPAYAPTYVRGYSRIWRTYKTYGRTVVS